MSGTLEILPANLLPLKARWKAISATLPQGSALIILPHHNEELLDTLLVLADLLKDQGREVELVPEQDL